MNLITDNVRRLLAEPPIYDGARRLAAENRLWKIVDRIDEDGTASAYVLDKEPEPQKVQINGSTWTCECKAGIAGRACVHLGTLVLRLSERRSSNEMFSLPLPKLPDEGVGLPEEDSMDPQQHLLFFTVPESSPVADVLVLGSQKTVSAALDTPGGPWEHQGISFQDMRHRPWLLCPALRPIRSDGSWGRLRAWKPGRPVLDTLQGNGSGALLEHLLSGTPPLTTGGEAWHVKFAKSVRLRFEATLPVPGNDPQFEPVVELMGETVDEPPMSGDLVSVPGALIILDEGKGSAGILREPGDALWFIRLFISRNVVTASDIQARFATDRQTPKGMTVVLPDLPETLHVLDPVLVLEIRCREGTTDLHPRFRYGGISLPVDFTGDIVTQTHGSRTQSLGLRNRSAEQAAFHRAEDIIGEALTWRRGRYAGLSGDPGIPLRIEMPLEEVLTRFGSALLDAGMDIRLEDRPVRIGASLGIRGNKREGMLDIHTFVPDREEEYQFDLDSWFPKNGLVRTTKAYFTLSEEDLNRLKFLRHHGLNDTGFLSTSPDNLTLIDAIYKNLAEADEAGLDFEHKRSIYRSLTNFSPEGVPPPPDTFLAALRPYQKYGYAWLLHLEGYALGGCLADDMGLGKTIQTLAYLSRIKADGRLGPSLLVGPVVTLTNWEAEIRRFAPDLVVHRYVGPAGRRILPEPGKDPYLVIVSYQTLRNDAEHFIDREWHHIILDEAHYVKNASSQTFKTVRSLRARHRISLTGTPMENHLDELWSQMSFLNPGLLGGHRSFTELYVRPVERHADEAALSRLSDIIGPFILRRRKADVLKDLPPKDEAVLRCNMADDQAEAYNTMRDLYLRRVTGLLSDEGLDGARIEILSILTKLRLLAIHPPLAGEAFAGISSGKMIAADNLLDEVLEEDHKTLVFSQFLGTLDRMEQTCRQRHWGFSRLTGSTKNREEPIRQFTEDPEIRIFLLSLRAGGIGINLTAADYVILLDPWWNPAVEAQAVDRAHRMGQVRPVMAYRLITSETIEEKVMKLQERKKALVAGVLGDGALPRLTEDEILELLVSG